MKTKKNLSKIVVLPKKNSIIQTPSGTTIISPKLSSWLEKNTRKDFKAWTCIIQGDSVYFSFADIETAIHFALVWGGEL